MSVYLSPVGGVAAQFFTNNGTPLTGGKLYTYSAGSTTPAATFTSSNGSTAWTNPIVLDAAGRVPGSGEIWLADGVIYKFILKDSNDVLIATYDNISGINSNSIAFTNQQEIVTATSGQTVFNLGINYQPGTNSLSVFVDGVNQYGPGAQYAYVETDSNTVTFNSGLHVGAEVKFTTSQQQGAGAVDAEQVSYQPPFTGSVATNVEAKLAQTVSVKDFGAVGDGVTDDTAAIQAADAAATGSVFFPAGVYKVTSAITKKLGVSWQGNGFASGAQSPQQPATKIVVDGPTSGNFITVQGATPGVGEANLFFDGIAFSATGASNDLLVGIYTFIKMTRIQNCSFTNFATGVKHGAVETWIVGNYFSSCAICIDSSGGESHITDNHGFPESIGILLRGSGTLVQGNKFFGDGASGDIGLEVWSKQNTIVNNVFDAFTDVGILLKSNTIGAAVDANVIVGNTISGIGNGGTYDSAIVMQALNANITNNTITGNSISNNRGDRVMVYGIKADVSAGRFLQNNAIVANTITSCTSAPLNFSGSGTRQFNVYRDNVGQAGTANKTFGTVAGYNGLTVTHNLGYTPDHVYVMPESNQVGAIGVDLITSTDFRLLMRDLSGVAIPSGSPVTTRWVAELIDLP